MFVTSNNFTHHRDPLMYAAYGPRGRYRNHAFPENLTWSSLDRSFSAIARCTITCLVMSERRGVDPSFGLSLKKIGHSVSVHQLPKLSWIFWVKLWIFWASRLHTFKLLSVRKETPASCGLVFEVFVYDSIVLLKAFCSKFRPSSLRYRGPALRRSRLEGWRENSKPHARQTRMRRRKL